MTSLITSTDSQQFLRTLDACLTALRDNLGDQVTRWVDRAMTELSDDPRFTAVGSGSSVPPMDWILDAVGKQLARQVSLAHQTGADEITHTNANAIQPARVVRNHLRHLIAVELALRAFQRQTAAKNAGPKTEVFRRVCIDHLPCDAVATQFGIDMHTVLRWAAHVSRWVSSYLDSGFRS